VKNGVNTTPIAEDREKGSKMKDGRIEMINFENVIFFIFGTGKSGNKKRKVTYTNW
jgi:hypothetical protein